MIVKPDTLIRWHRKRFRLFWKRKSRPRGRPCIPVQVRKLIVEMAMNNPTWGEERISNELLLKIGIQISPRTVRRYMPKAPKRPKDPTQRWMTFVRNHAKAIIASDFFVVVTATFQLVYVLVIMELDTRRILHFNVTRHPTAEWTLQQFRECVAGDEGYRFVIHDRDRIYSRELDASLKSLGLAVLKTPYKSPQANSFCERLVGSARRECFDFMIPVNEPHIRETLKSWNAHYNRGRPHSSLGPGFPDSSVQKAEVQIKRHCIPKDCRIVDLEQGESFGFLGFEFRRIRSRRGRWMPLLIPKGKKRTALLGKLRVIFRNSQSQPVGRLVGQINPILRGWVNYFAIGHSSRCFSFIRDWVEKKIRSHLARACQRRGFGWKRWSRDWLHGTLGLFNQYRVAYLSSSTAVPIP